MTNRHIKSAYERYQHSDIYSLYNAYGKPSEAKQAAWNYCINLCAKYNGFSLKVVSYNTCIFTAGFLFYQNDKLCYMHITPNYDQFIVVE